VNWRPCPFVPGSKYAVTATFESMFDGFVAGEELVFEGEAYSRYDGVTGYFFRDQSGESRRWDVPDEEDLIPSSFFSGPGI
jgi:hypothetical protein